MKNRNILFILTILLLLVGNALFNYKMDVYNVFNSKQNMRLQEYPDDLISILLKQHANRKYEYVLSGGSPITGMYDYTNDDKNFANIAYSKLNSGDATKLLDAFLSMHPEVKTVFFSIDYLPYLANFKFELNLDTNKFNLNDINKLYFSFDTTKKSFQAFIDKYFSKAQGQTEGNILKVYPKRSYVQMFDDIDVKKIEEKIHKEQAALKEIVDKYNVEVILFIPPFNVMLLSLIYESPFYEITKDIKKAYVNEYNQIIDMAFVNKHTRVSLWDNTFLYYDIVHPSFLHGVCLQQLLFNGSYVDKDVYMIITKDNIDEIIEQQEKLIVDYLKQNKDKLAKHRTYNPDPAYEDFDYLVVRKLDNLENEDEKVLMERLLRKN